MYQDLPNSLGAAKPVLQRVLQENAGTVLQVAGSRKRPDPPRSLVAQPGSLEVLLTWNAPYRSGDISGWRIYKDSESNLIDSIPDPNVRQARIKVPANTATAFYISSINASGRESIKVQIIAKANTDQLVTTGSTGATTGTTPSLPPGYSKEPSGGGSSSGQQKRTL